jgi:hypothetical protein
MFVLFFCHWYVNGSWPLAATANVAVIPTPTVWLAGFSVMTGALLAVYVTV